MSRELARLGGNHRGRHRAGVAVVVLMGVAAVAGIVAVDDARGEVAGETGGEIGGEIGGETGGEDEPRAAAIARQPSSAQDRRAVTAPRAPAGVSREVVTPTPAAAATPPLQPLGTVDGLELLVPAVDPVLVSYHEASLPEAQAITPSGAVAVNENTTRAFDRGGHDGPDYHVQVSRGRRQGPTTAVDLVLAAGEPVRAPVAGTVAEVRPYQLYGTHDDVRVELVPDDHPDLRVVLIHVEGVAVAAGDRVAAGDLLAAGARLLPLHSVVDQAVAPARHGHVHMEVKRPVAPSPSPSSDASSGASSTPDG